MYYHVIYAYFDCISNVSPVFLQVYLRDLERQLVLQQNMFSAMRSDSCGQNAGSLLEPPLLYSHQVTAVPLVFEQTPRVSHSSHDNGDSNISYEAPRPDIASTHAPFPLAVLVSPPPAVALDLGISIGQRSQRSKSAHRQRQLQYAADLHQQKVEHDLILESEKPSPEKILSQPALERPTTIVQQPIKEFPPIPYGSPPSITVIPIQKRRSNNSSNLSSVESIIFSPARDFGADSVQHDEVTNKGWKSWAL